MARANGERETFKEQLIITLNDQGSKTKSNITEVNHHQENLSVFQICLIKKKTFITYWRNLSNKLIIALCRMQ